MKRKHRVRYKNIHNLFMQPHPHLGYVSTMNFRAFRDIDIIQERISYTLRIVNWLNMKNRRLLHSIALFMKIINTKTPPYLYNKITYRSDVHNLNIRFRGTLTPPIYFSESFKRSFSYNIAQCVNGLPMDVRAITNKRLFRISLFNLLYDEQMGVLTG